MSGARNSEGKQDRGSLRGPTIMAFLRSIALKQRRHHSRSLAGARATGSAMGSLRAHAGVNKQTGQTWQVRAAAVVITTGGTTFLSGVAGTRPTPATAYLLAAELGAEFSGMEFTANTTPRPRPRI